MRRLVSFILAAGVAACLVACGETSTAPNAVAFGSVAGVYSLSTVNGSPPPLLVEQDDTASVEIVSGAITLGSDNSFTDVLSVQIDDPSGLSVQADTLAGVYSISGSTVLFQPSDNSGTYMASVTDSTLVETSPGVTVVYRRQ